MISKFKLFESPDRPINISRDTLDICDWEDNGTFPFGYIDLSMLSSQDNIDEYTKNINELKELLSLNPENIEELQNKLDSYKYMLFVLKNNLELYISNFHLTLFGKEKTLPYIEKDETKYFLFCGSEASTHGRLGTQFRTDQLLCGRVWREQKFISFWDYPRTNEELMKVLSDIEKSLKICQNIDINILDNLDDWTIESPLDLMPVKSYLNNFSKISDTELRQSHAKYENVKLFESPNEIFNLEHKLIAEPNWESDITFLYVNDKLVYGIDPHITEYFKYLKSNNIPLPSYEDENNYKNMKFAGRLFISKKILTFWNFPKNILKYKNIIKDLEKNLNIKIWNNDWTVEVIIENNTQLVGNMWILDRSNEQLIPVEDYLKINKKLINFKKDIINHKYEKIIYCFEDYTKSVYPDSDNLNGKIMYKK